MQAYKTLTRTQVDLILPQESVEALRGSLLERSPPDSRRVIMSLGEILSGDFLKDYIKQGKEELSHCDQSR